MNPTISGSLLRRVREPARRGILRILRGIMSGFDSYEVDVVDELSYPQHVPFNKLCGMAEMKNLEWRKALRDLDLFRKNVPFHRKAWEFGHGVYGLRKLNRLPPNAVALGVGSGHETILYFLANRIQKVVATDLYEGNFAGAEASPHMLHHPDMFAPFHFRKSHLQVLAMDARKLDFPSGSFDFVFSFSSIEHFGSRLDAIAALREMFRVLKPGGVAVVTTELILNRLGRAKGFFRRAEVEQVFQRMTGFRLVSDEIDYRVERRFIRSPADFRGQPSAKPYVVLKRGLTLFTSILLFLQKPTYAEISHRAAAMGDERALPLQRFQHKAGITSSVAHLSAKKEALLRIPLRMQNVGDVVWYNYPCETHTVRLGAHLLTASGECVHWDFARQDLPLSISPGEDVRMDLLLTAPRRRGDFVLEIEPVKEGVLWFAEDGSPTLRIPLRVE